MEKAAGGFSGVGFTISGSGSGGGTTSGGAVTGVTERYRELTQPMVPSRLTLIWDQSSASPSFSTSSLRSRTAILGQSIPGQARRLRRLTATYNVGRTTGAEGGAAAGAGAGGVYTGLGNRA